MKKQESFAILGIFKDKDEDTRFLKGCKRAGFSSVKCDPKFSPIL